MEGVANRGIVLLFDEETNKRARELSAELNAMLVGKDTEFLLGEERNLPHLSIIHLPIAELRIPSIHGWLAGFAETGVAKKAKRGSFSSIRLQKGYGLWLAPLTQELRTLHTVVITEMRLHRADRQPLEETFTDEETEMWVKYGAPNVGRNFEPHLTLLPQAVTGAVWQEEIFHKYEATHIALADIGPRGTVTNIRVKIPL